MAWQAVRAEYWQNFTIKIHGLGPRWAQDRQRFGGGGLGERRAQGQRSNRQPKPAVSGAMDGEFQLGKDAWIEDDGNSVCRLQEIFIAEPGSEKPNRSDDDGVRRA